MTNANSSKQKLITKDFVLLFLFMALACTAMNMLNFIIPLYVTDDLGGTTTQSGLMTTVFTFASCIFRPISGMLTDRFGRRKIMLFGASIYCLSNVFSALFPSLTALTICRVFTGIGHSSATTACNTASTDVMPRERLSEGIGYFGASQTVASIYASAVAAVFIEWVGNRYSLFWVAAILAAGFIVVLFIRYEKRPDYTRPVVAHQSIINRFYEKTALLPTIYEFISLVFVSGPTVFMILYLTERGFSNGICGIFFMIYSIIMVLVRLTMSHLLQTKPVWAIAIPGYIPLIVMLFIIPSINSIFGIYMMAILFGLEHGIVWMAYGSEAIRLAPPEKRGVANALFYLGFDLAFAVGSAIWGVSIDAVGYDTTFKIIAIGLIVLAALCYPVFRKRAKTASA